MSTSYQLPAFVDTNGEWDHIKDRLYVHFTRIFKSNPPKRILNKPLVFDSRCIDDELEEGFWHVITRGKPGDRKLDTARARRICWIEDILNGTNPYVTRWAYEEGDGTRKLYYWLKSDDYVLILAEKTKVVVLVTAFYVDNDWADKDLEKRLQKGSVF